MKSINELKEEILEQKEFIKRSYETEFKWAKENLSINPHDYASALVRPLQLDLMFLKGQLYALENLKNE